MIDFDRSYFTWTSRPYEPHPHYVNDGGMTQGAGSIRDVRIQYDARCTIRNNATNHGRGALPAPALSGRVYDSPAGFLHDAEHRIPCDLLAHPRHSDRAPPSTEVETLEPRPHKFTATRFTTRHYDRFSRLTSAREVIDATLADKPLNARTVVRDNARGYVLTLEYPIRTMNVNVEEGLFQVDTGPLPLPDMKTWDGARPARAFLSHVAFSRFDFAEFILRREVEPSDEDKKWLFQVRGKWRWELRDPKNPPPGHPPRPPWPTVYNETMRFDTTNEFLTAESA